MQEIKKYKITLIVVVQVICILALFNYISVKGRINGESNVYLILIFSVLMCGIYAYIAKKFWEIKKYVIYKIFSILNVLYIINIIGNFIKKSVFYCNTNYMLIPTIIVEVFLIINLVLIVIYNKNVQNLKCKLDM